jgi:hypothetical protein
MFLSGVQFRTHLDSRLKHVGMTNFGLVIYLTQQAAGNQPTGIRFDPFGQAQGKLRKKSFSDPSHSLGMTDLVLSLGVLCVPSMNG